ncbi:4-hydroxy-3-methylbut-2-enyl diphosphate reductase, partial [Kitasatospora indigofera]
VLGEAPDRTVVIESVEDVGKLDLPVGTPVACLTQTTLSFDETALIVAALRDRFDDLVTPGDDICYASQNRQNGVKELARLSDVVLVVGSANSSNSRRMVEVARAHGYAAHLVPDSGHLDVAWLDGASSIGVSAGASVPEVLVQGLVERLARLGYEDIDLHVGIAEDIVFGLPGRLASPAGAVPSTPLAGEVA